MEETTNESRSGPELVDTTVRYPDIPKRELERAYCKLRKRLTGHYEYFMYDKKGKRIVAVYNDPTHIIRYMRDHPGRFQIGHLKRDPEPYGL